MGSIPIAGSNANKRSDAQKFAQTDGNSPPLPHKTLYKRRERLSVQSLVQTAGTELPCGAENNFIYGKIPEWPNGSDCKSDVSDFGSSNLPLPTTQKAIPITGIVFCADRKK